MKKQKHSAFRIAQLAAVAVALGFASGCATTNSLYQSTLREGADKPLPPIPIQTPANMSNKNVLNGLPNETMLMAVGDVSADGKVTYLAASTGAKGRTYKVSLDYAKFRPEVGSGVDAGGTNHLFNYNVGVGLRITATFTTFDANVDLGSMFAIGLAAQQKRIAGTLSIETIGITGPSITPLLPMPSSIDTSTIQNAIQTMATVKAKMYDEKDVSVRPQVFYVSAPDLSYEQVYKAMTEKAKTMEFR